MADNAPGLAVDCSSRQVLEHGPVGLEVLHVAEPNRKPAQLPGGEAPEGEVGDAVLCAENSEFLYPSRHGNLTKVAGCNR